MSQLTAHIVYATFKALEEDQKEEFVRLIEEEKKKYSRKKRKRKSKEERMGLPPIYYPENMEMLITELWHG